MQAVKRYLPTIVLIGFIGAMGIVVAQAIREEGNQRPGIDEFTNDIQFYLVIIQVLFGLLIAIIGYLVRQQTSTINRIGEKYDALYERLLKEYATRDDLAERVHGMRDALAVHSTWIHILAHQMKVDLPQTNQSDGYRRKE